MTTKEK